MALFSRLFPSFLSNSTGDDVSAHGENPFIPRDDILDEEWLRGEQVVSLPTKVNIMQIVVLALFIVVLFVGAYSLKVSRTNADQRAREKRRNQFHDRI